MYAELNLFKKASSLLTLFALLAAPAFCSDLSRTAADQSSVSAVQLQERLENVKNADWKAAQDPSISPIRRGTFINQMNKADRVLKELNHGFVPAQSEIDDALWMPPRHITDRERALLIAQLKAAREQDEHNEQQMLKDLSWSRSSAPANTELFDQRKRQVDSVLKDLEIGAPVRWSSIKEALEVPKSSY